MRKELNRPLPFMAEHRAALLSGEASLLEEFGKWVAETAPAARAWADFLDRFASGAFAEAVQFAPTPCKDGFVDSVDVLWRAGAPRPKTAPHGDFTLRLYADFPRTSFGVSYDNAVETNEIAVGDLNGSVRFHFGDDLVVLGSAVGEEFRGMFCEDVPVDCGLEILARYRLMRARLSGAGSLEPEASVAMPDVHRRFLHRYLDERCAVLVG